jgi:hypothetical protein
MSIDNPRFPHTLTLTRVSVVSSGDDPFVDNPVEDDPFAEEVATPVVAEPEGGKDESETTIETLYEGECRSYRNVVTKTRDGVLVSDYVIAMPRVDFAILPMDKVVVVANNRTMEGVVVDSQTTNLGTNIWWNQKEN